MSGLDIEELRAVARGWYDQNVELIQERDRVWRENQELRAMARRAVDIAWGRALMDQSVPSSKIVDEIIMAARGIAAPPKTERLCSEWANACDQEEGA